MVLNLWAHMQRRDFITLLSGAAAACTLTAQAQQPKMPVIGYISSRSSGESTSLVAAFHRGLEEAGFVEGQNVAIEYRWAEGQYALLPKLAIDLVRREVTVIVAIGGPLPALAAKAATETIPIVFTTGADPIQQGLVASLNRPGGNLTGVYVLTSELEAKRLELLCEVVPGAAVIGMLLNPTSPVAESQARDVQAAARNIGKHIFVLQASSESGINAAFAMLIEQRTVALLVASDPFFQIQHNQLVALTARHRLSAIFHDRIFPAAGGLMSYGANIDDANRQVGIYAAKILKGARPADLPVLQPTKVELVINLKTAKVLGLTISPALLSLADEVLE